MLEAKKKGWYCEECDRTVQGYDAYPHEAEGAEGRAREAANASMSALVASWPSVLALPLREYVDEGHPVQKLWAACDVTELLLRFLVMLGVAEAAEGGALPESMASALAEQIETPTLGQWRRMAEELGRGQDTGRSAMPELGAYVTEVLGPLLDGPAKPRTAETSFAALRNVLAHGGGVTRASATRLLRLWQRGFEEAMARGAWLRELSVLARDASGKLGELRGPVTRPQPLPSGWTLPLEGDGSTPAEAMLVVRGKRRLVLWPLALHGEPRAADASTSGLEPAPQVYVRRGDVSLEYTPLGHDVACQSVGDELALEAFRRLFRLDSRPREARAGGFAVRGFENGLRKSSRQLVGRYNELETLARFLRETQHGVAWITGQAGLGKSFVLARAVCDLIDESDPRERLVLPYWFRVGDDRCSRHTFLKFAEERLGAWLGRRDEEEDEVRREPDLRKPLDKLEELLRAVPAGRQVTFVLDGLDEVAQKDAQFATEVPLALEAPRVLWLCAGRPERNLPEAFARAGAAEPFPAGLPRMQGGDIRSMLLEKLGPLRKKLLRGDRDEGDRVVNPFVERVAKNADGLPIYVTYVVGDVLQGKVSPDPGAPLPPSLAKYHEELLRRCAVGDLHAVMTPLVATLALAREPLTAEVMTALLARRGIVTGGDGSAEKVRQGLGGIASMIRLEPTPDGGDGYVLWHKSLRDHLLQSESFTETIATARAALAEAGLKPAGDRAERYLYRQGAWHLTKAGRRDDALVMLTDWEYMKVRLRALGPGSGAEEGLAKDWVRWLWACAIAKEIGPSSQAFGERLRVLCEWPADRESAGRARVLRRVLHAFSRPSMGARAFSVCLLAAEQAVALSETLRAMDPEDVDCLRSLSVAYWSLCDLAARTEAAKAREWHEKSLELAQQLVARWPENGRYQRGLSVSLRMLGSLTEDIDPAEAVEWHQRALEIVQRLVALEPENVQYLRDLSQSCNELGGLFARTASASAREWYEKELEIRQRLAALHPERVEFLRDLSISYAKLGRLVARTDPAKAVEWYERSLEIRQRLVALEPENMRYLVELSASYKSLGDLVARTDPAKSMEWYNKSPGIWQRLVARRPEAVWFRRELSASYERLGDLAAGTDLVLARECYIKAVEAVGGVAVSAADTWMAMKVSYALLRLGHVEGQMGLPDAVARFERAIVIRRDIVDATPGDSEAWEALGSALLHAMGHAKRFGHEADCMRHAQTCHTALDEASRLASEADGPHYDRACAFALTGESERALDAVARAVDFGFIDAEHALDDEDLEPLRASLRFKELVERMRQIRK